MNSLGAFLASTPNDGLPWRFPRGAKARGELLDSLKSTTSQRILVKSPPASGKTALLQGVVSGLLEKDIIVRGTAHEQDLQLVARLSSIIAAAPVGSVFIVDDVLWLGSFLGMIYIGYFQVLFLLLIKRAICCS
jgi:hypothetical protein